MFTLVVAVFIKAFTKYDIVLSYIISYDTNICSGEDARELYH